MKRKTTVGLVGGGLALCVLLAFLPRLVSTPPVRHAILQRARAATGARIEAERWSMAWFGPLRFENLVYEDNGSGVHFAVDSIRVSHGWLTLLRTRDAGDIVLDHPRLTVRRAESGRPAQAPVAERPGVTPTPPVPPPVETPSSDPWFPVEWPTFQGRMVVREGLLVLDDPAHGMTLADLRGSVTLQREPATLVLELNGPRIHGSGTVFGRQDGHLAAVLKLDTDDFGLAIEGETRQVGLRTHGVGRGVLQDLRLTDEMADTWLARLHPVFKGAVVTQGHIDLELDSMHIPIGPDVRSDLRFEGTLRLKEVELGAGNLLDEVRRLARLGEGGYRLGSHDLRFVCTEGRIETSPLRLTLDGHPVELAGSVGLDRSLAYTVAIPVTERLVGRAAYANLQGRTLTVPVHGTLDHPRLDATQMRTLLADPLRQAAETAVERGLERLLRRHRDP